MPLIPVEIDDVLYRRLSKDAEQKKIPIIEYIKYRLAQPDGVVVVSTFALDEVMAALDTREKALSMVDHLLGTHGGQIVGEVLEIEGERGEGEVIQPAADPLLPEQIAWVLANGTPGIVAIADALSIGRTKATRLQACCREISAGLAQHNCSVSAADLDLEGIARVIDASRAKAKANVADDFEPFWLVARDQGDGKVVSATKRQTVMFIAEQEAERLCRKEQAPFLVLQSVARCEAEPAPVKWQLAGFGLR